MPLIKLMVLQTLLAQQMAPTDFKQLRAALNSQMPPICVMANKRTRIELMIIPLHLQQCRSVPTPLKNAKMREGTVQVLFPKQTPLKQASRRKYLIYNPPPLIWVRNASSQPKTTATCHRFHRCRKCRNRAKTAIPAQTPV
jgi:hypothetical protein